MSDYIPTDLWTQILEKLPTKSLCQFRCVCTTWNTLITSTNFISSHLTATTMNPSNRLVLVVRITGRRRRFDICQDISVTSRHKRITFPFVSKYDIFRVVGVCNGVICISLYSLTTKSSTVLLWNPNICRYVTAPNFPNSVIDYNIMDDDPALGFAFDPITNDLKVVSLPCHYRNLSVDGIGSSMAFVFSAREGGWRAVVNAILPYTNMFGERSAPFLNGSIHWARLDQVSRSWKLLVFDCESEQFRTFNPPASLTEPNVMSFLLITNGLGQIDLKVYKGKLSIYKYNFPPWSEIQGIDVWVMNEYGVADSWSKLLTIPFHEGFVRVLLAREEDEGEVFLNEDGSLTSYDIDTGRKREIGAGLRTKFGDFYLDAFKPSLLLMDVERSAPCGGAKVLI